MSIESHIQTLKQKHLELKNSIKNVNDNLTNEQAVKNLKKQKLIIKERIIQLEENA
jgi:hypothetical protein